MPLLASVVSGPISKPFPSCIFKFHVSYFCIVDVLYHSTNLENFLLYISLVKYCFFVHHRLIMYINLFFQLISFIYMLLTSFNCYTGPRDSEVLTSSSLIRRLVRACVPRWSKMLPPKLYLVVFYQVSLENRTKMICSDFKRPSEVLLGSACCTISHVHTLWGSCNKMFQHDSVCKRLGLLEFICQSDQPRVLFPLVIIGC